MWTNRLRSRMDDTVIPRKKSKVSVPLQNCSQKQDDPVEASTSSKNTKLKILPHRAVGVTNIEPVLKCQPKEIDKNLKEDTKIPANVSYISLEGTQISLPVSSPSPVIKITPTVLEKLFVTPKQNHEIKIREADDENDDYNVIVELVDHSTDCVSTKASAASDEQSTAINNEKKSAGTEGVPDAETPHDAVNHKSHATKASAASDEQCTVLNNGESTQETQGLPDGETPQDTGKNHSSPRFGLKKNAAQTDIMSSKKDLSALLPKNDLSTEVCKNEISNYIVTRSRSRKAANVAVSAEVSISKPLQIKNKPENSNLIDKQSSSPKRQVVKKKKTVSKYSGKMEVYDLPKFRPWPRVTRWPSMGTFKSQKRMRLIDNDFGKLKSIFLDSPMDQIDEKWQAKLLGKGHHGSLEWKMFQLYGKNHQSMGQECAMNDIARKLNHKQATGARILNLSKEIYQNLAAEGLEQPVVEVIVHHAAAEYTPATAWLLRQPQILSMTASQSNENGVSDKAP